MLTQVQVLSEGHEQIDEKSDYGDATVKAKSILPANWIIASGFIFLIFVVLVFVIK